MIDSDDPAARARTRRGLSKPARPRAAGSANDIVVLAGGTGGAKLARGVLDVVGPERLAVIANTGDDIEIYGAHVSPDPDLVCFWLADLIDGRGWGLRDDTFSVMDALRGLGVETWFNLGDRDLAWCMERARLLADGGLSATAALARLNDAIGLRARVLPMCDEPVRTWVRTAGRWRSFQEFMIRERGAGPIEGVELRGIERARPTREALAAIAAARAIVIGPSNPLVSIDPILAVPGMREALRDAPAPIVAVSPIVGGEVLKGPTAAFMAFAGHELSARGIAEHYAGLLDGLVTDELPGEPLGRRPIEPPGKPLDRRPTEPPAVLGLRDEAPSPPVVFRGGELPALRAETYMPDAAARSALAERVLAFADTLAANGV